MTHSEPIFTSWYMYKGSLFQSTLLPPPPSLLERFLLPCNFFIRSLAVFSDFFLGTKKFQQIFSRHEKWCAHKLTPNKKTKVGDGLFTTSEPCSIHASCDLSSLLHWVPGGFFASAETAFWASSFAWCRLELDVWVCWWQHCLTFAFAFPLMRAGWKNSVISMEDKLQPNTSNLKTWNWRAYSCSIFFSCSGGVIPGTRCLYILVISSKSFWWFSALLSDWLRDESHCILIEFEEDT